MWHSTDTPQQPNRYNSPTTNTSNSPNIHDTSSTDASLGRHPSAHTCMCLAVSTHQPPQLCVIKTDYNQHRAHGPTTHRHFPTHGSRRRSGGFARLLEITEPRAGVSRSLNGYRVPRGVLRYSACPASLFFFPFGYVPRRQPGFSPRNCLANAGV